MAGVSEVGIGRIGEIVRGLIGRLAPLEENSALQGSEIKNLKRQTQIVQAEVETLKGMADTQDGEAAIHHQKLAELEARLRLLDSKVSNQEAEIKKMSSALHGQKVKAGIAKSKAARAETALIKAKSKNYRKPDQ